MVYLDNHATTQVDPQVCDLINTSTRYVFGNPHVNLYKTGWEAMDVVEKARAQVAKSVGARPSHVIFTSGATESNNIILKGIVTSKNRNKILISSIEHSCVRESAKYMQKKGYTVHHIPVDEGGILDIRAFEALLDESVCLVSVMLVNNEIGTIQDIKRIAAMTHAVGAILHSDCAQALGKMPINMKDMDIDVMSLSAHKIYGPKGVGALVVSSNIRINPLFSGGGQERGMRSGTVSPPLVAGFGLACKIASTVYDSEHLRILSLRNTLQENLLGSSIGFRVLGDINSRICGNLCLYLPGVRAEAFFAKLRHIELSSGSACFSGQIETSTVLQAIGISAQKDALVLRMCVGRFNTKEDIDTATKEIIETIQSLRNI